MQLVAILDDETITEMVSEYLAARGLQYITHSYIDKGIEVQACLRVKSGAPVISAPARATTQAAAVVTLEEPEEPEDENPRLSFTELTSLSSVDYGDGTSSPAEVRKKVADDFAEILQRNITLQQPRDGK